MMTNASTAQVETPGDLAKSSGSKPEQDFVRWKAEIERAEKHNADYYKRCEAIQKRYRVEAARSRMGGTRRYNVLWSMANTLAPNLFMGMPKPYVSRRYRDKDPIARAAAQILERILVYVNDSDQMHDAFAAAVDDYILNARGCVWTRYKPEFDLRHSESKTYYSDGEEVPKGAVTGRDKSGLYYRKQYEAKVGEECETDHIPTPNMLFPACSSYKTLPWAAKRVLMTRTELVDRFGQKGNDVPLLYRSDGTRNERSASAGAEADGMFLTAAVWEVWIREGRKVIWICLDGQEILDEKDDPLELTRFFPFPAPLTGTRTPNTIIPVPDFKYYEDIANELDELTHRIALLTESIRVVAIYDATLGDIMKRLTTETRENDVIPVENYSALLDKGGLRDSIQYLPIEQMMKVLRELYEARKALLQELYDITGMSDIIRGTTDPRETAAAQKIKGSYAAKRLVRRQKDVARFAREHLEIQAEIICKHYDDETIKTISGADQLLLTPDGAFDEQMFASALALLRDKPLRIFRIKIDNETLAGDEAQEHQQQAIQFITQVGQLVNNVIPMAQRAPQLGRVLKEVILFGIRAFPVARSVEASIEQALEELAQSPPQPDVEKLPEPKGPSPEEIQIKMRELDIREQELGLRRQELALKDWETKQSIGIGWRRLANDNAARMRQIEATLAAKKIDVEQKERDGGRKVVAEAEKHARQLDHDERSAERDREIELNINLADMERALRDADETRRQDDRHHADRIGLEVERMAREENAAARAAAFKGVSDE